MRKKWAKPLIVEDTTNKQREDLDPNRFKNRVRSQPKPVYNQQLKDQQLSSLHQAILTTPPKRVLRKS